MWESFRDISATASMHMEQPGFETFDKVKKCTLMRVKVLQTQKRKARGGLNLVDAHRGVDPSEHSQAAHDEAKEVVTEMGLAKIFAPGLEPAKQAAEIYTVMSKKFVRKGPAGGAPR